MEYNTERKINVKKLFVTVIISFALLILSVISIYNNVVTNNIKKAMNNYSLKLTEIKNEKEAKQKEEEERQANIIANRYKPLNENELAKIDNIYEHSEPKRVFLTFDDGPTDAVTPYILNLLKEQKIKANFFVLGSMVENYPSLVKREFDEGHFIGNHGYTHKYKEIYQSVDTVIDEFTRTNNAIKNAIGNQNYNSLVFRFPGGSIGGYYSDLKNEAKQRLRDGGVASLDWNALTKDSEGATTKEELMQGFYETIQDKTSIVLLMHDSPDKILTYEVLPDIISYLREQGYEFKTLNDIIERE